MRWEVKMVKRREVDVSMSRKVELSTVFLALDWHFDIKIHI
jgi:hypothetical protein